MKGVPLHFFYADRRLNDSQRIANIAEERYLFQKEIDRV